MYILNIETTKTFSIIILQYLVKIIDVWIFWQIISAGWSMCITLQHTCADVTTENCKIFQQLVSRMVVDVTLPNIASNKIYYNTMLPFTKGNWLIWTANILERTELESLYSQVLFCYCFSKYSQFFFGSMTKVTIYVIS